MESTENSSSAPKTKTQAEKYEICNRICSEKRGLYMDSSFPVCSNKGKSYKERCFLFCEQRFVDNNIKIKYLGKCWHPGKIPFELDNYEWMDKI